MRPFAADDLGDLREVCLRTGDLGADGSALTAWPDLVGDVYAAPYAVADPGLVTVVELDLRVVGYVIGCRDTLAFEAWCAEHWWPALRERYPAPGPDASAFDAPLLRQVHTAPVEERPYLATHPSHLHVDLLPVAQGLGLGRRLIDHVLGRLRDAGSPGVHLGVGAANTRAVGFYARLGLRPLVEPEPGATSYVLGRSFAADGDAPA
ncbi:GNAT family N-acetyltransferase [Kineosporiaceae bacterium B12]|nr:GNAT family N-acetyltransferase [Kineococcus rubinsiae]